LKIELVYNAGSSVSKKHLVASTVNNMLVEVTKNYNAKELAENIDFYGAYFETSASRDYASVVLYSLIRFFTAF
jgi:predicted Zn-dependent peptidase